jgi:hypothetical protein
LAFRVMTTDSGAARSRKRITGRARAFSSREILYLPHSQHSAQITISPVSGAVCELFHTQHVLDLFRMTLIGPTQARTRVFEVNEQGENAPEPG